MELAKDNLDPATQRDIRDTQAIMLAGFEVCLEMLGMILQTQKTGQTLSLQEVDDIIKRNRETFLEAIERRRTKFFHTHDL